MDDQHTDDQHTDPRDLASAYLDGQITADERARVDGSDELLSEVARLRTVRALLAEVDDPRIAVREEHLATALGAWDRLPEGERTGIRHDATPAGAEPAVAAAAATITTSPRRRPPRTVARWGAAAAAAVVVLGAGVVLSQIGDSDDGDVAERAIGEPLDGGEATEEAAEAGATELEAEPEAAAVPAADEAFGDGDGAGDAAELTAEDLEAEEAEEAATLSEEEASAEPSRDQAAGGDVAASDDPLGPPPDGDVSSLALLRDRDDLAAFAAPAREATDSPTAATSPFPTCEQLGIDVVVGPAAYLGSGPVVVGIDRSRDVAIAYLESCAIVATAALP